jgi:hypothetical protein
MNKVHTWKTRLRGFTGGTGFAGFTGGTGFAGLCQLCGKASGALNRIDIDLNNLSEDDTPVEIFYVCTPCIESTKDLIQEIKASPLNKLPLYINQDNIFVKHTVSSLLNGDC